MNCFLLVTQVLINKLFHSYITWYLHTTVMLLLPHFLLLLDSNSLIKMLLNKMN